MTERSARELADRLAAEGLDAGSWSNGPGDRYAAHQHGYDKVLVVASGSISFGLVDRGARADLAVGDRLDLPASTSHDAVVGPNGVVCLEAHAPAPERSASSAAAPPGSGEDAAATPATRESSGPGGLRGRVG